MEVLFFHLIRPTDELIPAGNPPGMGAPAEAGNDLAVEKGHILWNMIFKDLFETLLSFL